MKKHFSHGEVVGFQIESMPSGVKKMEAINGKYILADSENTGNHHCLEAKEGIELYEKNGVMYLKNDVEVDVFCVVKNRHDTETLKPGIWEFDKAREYDYMTDETRKVAD